MPLTSTEIAKAQSYRYRLLAIEKKHLPKKLRQSRAGDIPRLVLFSVLMAGIVTLLWQFIRIVMPEMPLVSLLKVAAWAGGGSFFLVGNFLLAARFLPPTEDEALRVIRAIREREHDTANGRLMKSEIVQQLRIEAGIPLAWADGGKTRLGLDYQSGEGHALVVGPTRSGKGLQLTDTLLRWPGPLLVVDPKGEQFERTAGTIAVSGRPIYRIPGDSVNLSEYFDLTSQNHVAALHDNLMRPWQDRERIFADKARLLFRAVGEFATATGTNPVRALLLSADKPLGQVLEKLDEVTPQYTRAFTDGLSPGDAVASKFIQSAWGTWTTRAFEFSQHIDTLASSQPTIPPNWAELGGVIFVTYPLDELQAVGPALSAMIAALVRYHLRSYGNRPIRTLFAIDELPAVAVANLSRYLATVGSSGIAFLLYAQSAPQLVEVYGQQEAQNIMANCRSQVWFAPADQETAEMMSRLYGETSRFTLSGSADEESRKMAGKLGLMERVEPAIKPAEFMSMARDKVLVMCAQGGRQVRFVGDRTETYSLFEQLPPAPLLKKVAVAQPEEVVTVEHQGSDVSVTSAPELEREDAPPTPVSVESPVEPESLAPIGEQEVPAKAAERVEPETPKKRKRVSF